MKCPHCTRSVAIFARTLNDVKNEKRCPYCGGKVEVYINLKLLAIFLVPALVVGLALRAKLGVFGTGIAAGLAVFFSMRLRTAIKK